ncbi:MAG: hypothetical protein ACRCX8_16645 [Sarcina sp.]
MSNKMEPKAVAYTAAALVHLDRTNPVFEKAQVLRVLREMTLETKDSEPMSHQQAIQIIVGLQQGFKETLNRTNKKLVEFRKERTKLLKLDPNAYANEIAEKLAEETDLSTKNENVRKQMAIVDGLYKCLVRGHDWTSEADAYLKKITSTVKTLNAIKTLAKDKDRLNWIIREPITSLDMFKEHLTKYSINEQESMMKDFAQTMRNSLVTFRTQLKFVKEYVKNTNRDLYLDIENFESMDLVDLTKPIEFIKEFKKYYLSVSSVEEFLKLDGITDELTDSMDMIIYISNVLNKIGFGTDADSIQVVQDMVDESIKQNQTIIEVAYTLVVSSIHNILKITDEDDLNNEEYLYKCITLLLIAVYHLLDIRAGSSTITLMCKIK